MRQIDLQLQGKVDWQIEVNKAQRQERLWVCSNIIAAVYATAGKMLNNPPTAKAIFDRLTSNEVSTSEDEYADEDPDDGGSLAAAKAERAAREAQRGDTE